MHKSYFKSVVFPVTLMSVIMAGCGNLGQVTQPENQGKGIAMLKIVAATGSPFQKLAKKATLTITAIDILTMSRTLTVTDSSVQGTITGIPAGKNRLFSVAVYDSLDTLQYKGSSNADVLADSTVKVTINVVRVMGNAIINGNIIDTNPVTDIDGNVYHTVTIGTQVWMVENLKTTKYNDGTAIPLDTSTATWVNATTAKYCWYNNDMATNKNTYGALYNWFVVNTGKLAPAGWHVPTDSELTVLTTYLGGESVAGGKLKETGLLHWASSNTGATNVVGFAAIPGGYRSSNGSFKEVGSTGSWWSSTSSSALYSWCRFMYYNNATVGRSYNDIQYGFSVRCIKG